MNSSQLEDDGNVTHVVYDKVSGRVLGTLRNFDVPSGKDTSYDTEKVLSLFSTDPGVLSKVTNGDIANLAVTIASLPVATSTRSLRFSDKRQALVLRPRLRLRADREVLEGNGEDSLAITIDVVDDDGRVQRDYKGEVHVTTTRGKLSTKGGRVQIKSGQASITLTSVRETVERVTVTARTADGSAVSDDMTLSFE